MTSTDARSLAFELWKLLRTGEQFGKLRRRYNTIRSLRDGGGASSSEYARRHRWVMRLGRKLNRARVVLGGRIRQCRQKVNGLAAGPHAGEPWRTEVRRRLTPALSDLTDAIQRTLEIHPESGAGPTHTEILGALDRHETDIRECGQFLSDVAAVVQSVTRIDEHSREPRSDQSTGSHPGDDLLRYLADRPDQMTAVIELPDRFQDPDMLTVSDADGLIEFGTRNHCWVGPVGKSELQVEKGWDFGSITGPNCKSMDEFLAEVLTSTDDKRIRQHVHLTAKGRVRAARLSVKRPASEAEPKPKPAAMGTREVQRRLLEMCDAGEPYTTVRDLKKLTGCGSTSTVSNAINGSKTLQEWRDRHSNRKRRPRASSLTDVHLDKIGQTREPNPAEEAEANDEDAIFNYLVEEAETPKERDKLHSLSLDRRRELIELIRNDPDRGSRLLGRRP